MLGVKKAKPSINVVIMLLLHQVRYLHGYDAILGEARDRALSNVDLPAFGKLQHNHDVKMIKISIQLLYSCLM